MGLWWQDSHKWSLANTLGLFEEYFPMQVILPTGDDEIAQQKITSVPSHFFSLQQQNVFFYIYIYIYIYKTSLEFIHSLH